MHINAHEFVDSYSTPAFSHHMISHVHNKKREVRGACELENIVYEREDQLHLSSPTGIAAGVGRPCLWCRKKVTASVNPYRATSSRPASWAKVDLSLIRRSSVSHPAPAKDASDILVSP